MFGWCCKKKVTRIDPYDEPMTAPVKKEFDEDQDFSGSKEEGFDTRSNQLGKEIKEQHRVTNA